MSGTKPLVPQTQEGNRLLPTSRQRHMCSIHWGKGGHLLDLSGMSLMKLSAEELMLSSCGAGEDT